MPTLHIKTRGAEGDSPGGGHGEWGGGGWFDLQRSRLLWRNDIKILESVVLGTKLTKYFLKKIKNLIFRFIVLHVFQINLFVTRFKLDIFYNLLKQLKRRRNIHDYGIYVKISL